jgi:hypothetical protein
MEERREFIDRYTALEYHEVQPHIDFEHTKGLVEEINQALAQHDRAEAQRRQLVVPEPLVHDPQPPVEPAEPRAEAGAIPHEPDEARATSPDELSLVPPSL